MPNSAVNPGQAVVEYELIVPNGKPLVLNSNVVVHVSSVLQDNIFGACVYVHTLRSTNTEFVDNQIKEAMASSIPRLRFRLGVGQPDNTFWLPWQEHIIYHYSAILESVGDQSGHTLEIRTMDYMFLLQRPTETAARKGTVSGIVEGITKEYGLKDVVIEPTTGVGAYIQSYQDHASFIRERMVRRARNDKGRGNYLFYFKDNVLHFHSPDYQADLHNVIYYQANSASLVQSDNSQKLVAQGVDATEMTVYDPYTAKTKVIGSDPQKSLKYADSIYNLSLIPGGKTPLFLHAGPGIPDEGEVIGQNIYESVRANTFVLNLEVQKTIQIRHGDFINLIVTPADKKASPWSGYYLVTSVKHIVQKNAVTSLYTLARGEIKKSLANLTNVNAQDILVFEQEAPGQPLNLPEIKSSQRTKGAGNLAADGRLFATVQSPG